MPQDITRAKSKRKSGSACPLSDILKARNVGCRPRVTRALRTAERKREGREALIKSRDQTPTRYAEITEGKQMIESAIALAREEGPLLYATQASPRCKETTGSASRTLPFQHLATRFLKTVK